MNSVTLGASVSEERSMMMIGRSEFEANLGYEGLESMTLHDSEAGL